MLSTNTTQNKAFILWIANMKPYCTQNDGDSASCNLPSYGRDCNNVRIITAHKKGRTERVPTRATPLDKGKLKALGISAGDLFAWAVANYPKSKPLSSKRERNET